MKNYFSLYKGMKTCTVLNEKSSGKPEKKTQ